MSRIDVGVLIFQILLYVVGPSNIIISIQKCSVICDVTFYMLINNVFDPLFWLDCQNYCWKESPSTYVYMIPIKRLRYDLNLILRSISFYMYFVFDKLGQCSKWC